MNKVWKCDVCGIESTWGDNWQWFGNYDTKKRGSCDEQIDHVTCSDACREAIPDPSNWAHGRATE